MRKIFVFEGGDGTGKKTQTSMLIQKLKNKFKYRSDVAIVRFEVPNYESDSSFFVKKYLNGDFPVTKTSSDIYIASISYAMDHYFTWNSPIKDDDWKNKNPKLKNITYAELWKKYLEYGFKHIFIICDRYYHSNLIFQGARFIERYVLDNVENPYEILKEDPNALNEFIYKGIYFTEYGKFSSWLDNFESVILKLPTDNFSTEVLYLSVPIEVAQRNLNARYHNNETKKDIHEKNLLLQYIVRYIAKFEFMHKGIIECCYKHKSETSMKSANEISDEIFNYVNLLIQKEINE